MGFPNEMLKQGLDTGPNQRCAALLPLDGEN